MLNQVWKNCHSSVCNLNFINERGVHIDSLTGFKVNKSLVTSEHVFYVNKAKKVEISFVAEDAITQTASILIPFHEFINNLKVGYLNDKGNCAVFNIDFPEFLSIPGLKLSERRHFPIGQQIAFLAYGTGSTNLALRTGIVSSYFLNTDNVRFLQFDGLSCYGNSGGPVIDPETMQVIGIISRRNTPASKAYKQLLDIITANLEELKKVESVVKFGDVDPIQVLIANQNQLKHLVNNIYHYTANGTTQAVLLDQIISYFNENTLADEVQNSEIAKIDINFN